VIQETYIGRAEVRNTFRVKGARNGGGLLRCGRRVKRDAQVRVVRDGAIVYTSKLSSLKRFQGTTPAKCARGSSAAPESRFQRREGRRYLECFQVTKLSARTPQPRAPHRVRR